MLVAQNCYFKNLLQEVCDLQHAVSFVASCFLFSFFVVFLPTKLLSLSFFFRNFQVEEKAKTLGIVKYGDLYLAREKKEGRLEDQDVNLALDTKLPFGAENCGLFSCHGIEPKFTRTGFEVKGKINQDRGGMQWPFGGRSDCAFFAVTDGHGRNGEKISEHCMRHLPKLLQASPFLHSDPGKALKKAFLDVDAQVSRI